MRWIVTAILMMGSMACGGPRLMVRDAAERNIQPPADGHARIVFAVPGSLRDVVSIVDERGNYVGQLGGRTWMTIEVEPGSHRYYAFIDASAWVALGTIEPNRTYWVLAETGLGRSFRWVAWAPECHDDVNARIAGARAVEPDPHADPALLRRQLGNVPQRILEADRELDEMSRVERDARTMRPACEGDVGDTQTSTP